MVNLSLPVSLHSLTQCNCVFDPHKASSLILTLVAFLRNV